MLLLTWMTDVCHWTTSSSEGFIDFYATSLRSNLFSGLLTVSAFIFSIKTFLLMALERDIYSSDEYAERVEGLETIEPVDIHKPLKNIHKSMSRAVWVTFIAAFSQVTIGLIPINWATSASLALATLAALYIGWSFYVHHMAMRDWFDVLKRKSDKKLSQIREGMETSED